MLSFTVTCTCLKNSGVLEKRKHNEERIGQTTVVLNGPETHAASLAEIQMQVWRKCV